VELSGGNSSRSSIPADQIMMPSAIAEALGIDRDRSAPRTSLGVSMDPIDGFVGHLTVF
jgi:hypothetical protein